MVSKAAYDFLYLVKCAVNAKAPEIDRINNMNMEKVYFISEFHMLNSMVATALESAGHSDKWTKKSIGSALRKAVVLDNEKKFIFEQFEKNKIWYMPLKGTILKDYYPKYGLRQMGDCDILYDCDKAKDVRAIFENSGFQVKSFGESHHDVYLKPPFCCFEMHRMLYEERQKKNLYQYYVDVKERLIKDTNNNYGFHFSPEDLYIYIVSHAFAHYSGHGTGFRSVLDVYYLLKNHEELDFDYIRKESAKMGIDEFEEVIRNLAIKFFGGEPLGDKEKILLSFILNAGTYGSTNNRVAYQVYKLGRGQKGRMRFVLGRIFPSSEWIQNHYPFIYKTKVLIIIIPFVRIFSAMTTKRKVAAAELKAIRNNKTPLE